MPGHNSGQNPIDHKDHSFKSGQYVLAKKLDSKLQNSTVKSQTILENNLIEREITLNVEVIGYSQTRPEKQTIFTPLYHSDNPPTAEALSTKVKTAASIVASGGGARFAIGKKQVWQLMAVPGTKNISTLCTK